MGLSEPIYVVKRDGSHQAWDSRKIIERIQTLAEGLAKEVDVQYVAAKTIAGIHKGILSSQLDELAAETAAARVSHHPDYGMLAARLAVSNLHKEVDKSLVRAAERMRKHTSKRGVPQPLMSDRVYNAIINNAGLLQAAINHTNDYNLDYFGFKTVLRFLLKIDNKPVERPQHMYMRVAVELFSDDMVNAIKTYRFLSSGWFTVSSPAYFHAGTPRNQMASCFLLDMQEDSIEGIYETLKRCAVISKNAGGIGLNVTKVRSQGSYIAGTTGESNGLVPMLRNFDSTAYYVDQGGNKRPGAFAIYLEPWHPDVENWLAMKVPKHGLSNNNLQSGEDKTKGLDLFYALWIEDEFFRRAEANAQWSLMDPNECPGLEEVYGDEFVALYERYEREGRAYKTVNARELLGKIIDVQIETGGPYMCSKTAANQKSNQANIGTIKSSNLCVTAETLVLTRQGHREIGRLAAERLDAIKKNNIISEMSDSESDSESDSDSDDKKKILDVKLATTTVDVWNGCEWSPVEVMQTGTNQEVMTVETSFGVRINCTPQHEFVVVRDDGSHARVAAQDLRLNDRLPAQFEAGESYDNRPKSFFVNYDGDENTKASNPFLSGYIMGYVIKKHGMEERFLRNSPDTLELPVMVIDASNKTLLDRLGYDPKARLPDEFYVPGTDGFIPGVDKFKHDMNVVYMPVPENHRRLRWCLAGTRDVREEWACGFQSGLGQLSACQGGHYFLHKCALMMQSTGRNCKMTSMGHESSEAYRLQWCPLPSDLAEWTGLPENEIRAKRIELWNQIEPERPTITALRRVGRRADVFCFTEHKMHQGVFNGQLAGQCTEIYEVATPNEIASCTLSSIGLCSFVNRSEVFDHSRFQPTSNAHANYDFRTLHEVTKHVTLVLNQLIDMNYYPMPIIEQPNKRDRPIGIGVQGLANVFCTLGLPFTGPEARRLNSHIFECIYYAFLEASCELAQKHGPYETFHKSPISEGKLQFDLWGEKPKDTWLYSAEQWDELRQRIRVHGVRNSLGVALMPTATTAQVLGNNESIEPFTANLYSRKVTKGTYFVVNKHLIADLIAEGKYDSRMHQDLIKGRGSVQAIDRIPQRIKDIYKTVWEIKQTDLLEMNRDRSIFVDQGVSFNYHISDPTRQKMFTMIFKAWRLGLKTLMYYLRSRSSTDAVQFSVKAERRPVPVPGAPMTPPKTPARNANDENDDGLSPEERQNVIKACTRNDPTCESCHA